MFLRVSLSAYTAGQTGDSGTIVRTQPSRLPFDPRFPNGWLRAALDGEIYGWKHYNNTFGVKAMLARKALMNRAYGFFVFSQ